QTPHGSRRSRAPSRQAVLKGQSRQSALAYSTPDGVWENQISGSSRWQGVTARMGGWLVIVVTSGSPVVISRKCVVSGRGGTRQRPRFPCSGSRGLTRSEDQWSRLERRSCGARVHERGRRRVDDRKPVTSDEAADGIADDGGEGHEGRGSRGGDHRDVLHRSCPPLVRALLGSRN